LVDEPVYVEAVKLALSMMAQGKDNDALFQAVLDRSVEINAIRHLVGKGSKPENIVLTPLHILWRE
jgi:hypothetical protein